MQLTVFLEQRLEHRVMHSKSNNIKLTSYNNANEVADELFVSLPSRYQNNLEKSMAGIEFIFDSVQLMYHVRHGGSYIDSPGWTKKKKATINQK